MILLYLFISNKLFLLIYIYRRYEVDKIYKLEQGLKLSNSQRIFLVSNNLISCKRVLDQIQSEISHVTSHVQVCHHLLVIPFIPTVLHTLIEEEGQFFIICYYYFYYISQLFIICFISCKVTFYIIYLMFLQDSVD